MRRNPLALASLAAFLFASAAPAAYAVPAFAGPVPRASALPLPAPAGALDKLREAVRGGLVHLATAFTNAGAAIVTNRMVQGGTAPNKIGWGTGTTAAAVGQTALVTEAAPTTAGGRVSGTESRTTDTVANDNYQVQGTITATTGLAVTEAGLFDAASAGNMLIRGDFAAVNVGIGDAIQFTFGLRFVPTAA